MSKWFPKRYTGTSKKGGPVLYMNAGDIDMKELMDNNFTSFAREIIADCIKKVFLVKIS